MIRSHLLGGRDVVLPQMPADRAERARLDAGLAAASDDALVVDAGGGVELTSRALLAALR